MNPDHGAHLARLADPDTRAALAATGFAWTVLDTNVCAAARFKRLVPDAPAMVGLLGGASSGKSTLFNSLLGREVSRISAQAHETLGPIVAVHGEHATRLTGWLNDRLIFAESEVVSAADGVPTTGRVGAVCIHAHNVVELAGALLLDLPDVTSKMAADEGAITRNLLPFFDLLIVVVDEERWYDAAVFEETVERCRNFAPRLAVVFNRTERAGPLAPADAERLAEHARSRRADVHFVCGHAAGCGYRPVPGATRSELVQWLRGIAQVDRANALEACVRRRSAELVEENVTRAERFARLVRDVDAELAQTAAEANLSLDLLTGEERSLLGFGHRFVPLYDMFAALRRRLHGLGLVRLRDVDFDKSPHDLAAVLRRNLEVRFRRATDRIDELLADSGYLSPQARWSNTWALPGFDAVEWARRIRAHVDAWKQESTRRARTGDAAALSVAVPLLVADLLFLGGAGMTLPWAAAALAGFFGGKGVAQLALRCPAFEAYRTTVRAYQSFLREALAEQWEANLTKLPRRHLKMSDPILEALLTWATPG